MSATSPIFAAYRKLLTKGRLQPNSAQLALVEQLGLLQKQLLSPYNTSWRGDTLQNTNGIYIYGGVGTGKSRIADLFASTLPKNVSCRRIHFHEFMVDIHQRLHHARSRPNYSGDPLIHIGKAICSETSILCFDEFQVSDIADAMILKRLFGSFWTSGGVMVATSNRHPTELYLDGLNRPLFVPFINHLQQKCLVWKMSSEHDYRLNMGGSKRTPVFLTDTSVFASMLREATHGKPLQQKIVEVVMNRTLNVQAVTGEDHSKKAVVHSTFHELCQQSLGASDYHALCGFADTIFISGFRSFGANELDFVRRFITLIDVAYESRSRIICLSNTPLESLFQRIGIDLKSKSSGNPDEATPLKNQDSTYKLDKNLTVKGEGGSSSSMMSTFINDVEWSATGLTKASLATGGAGETDVRFAVGRAISRLSEMESAEYGMLDG